MATTALLHRVSRGGSSGKNHMANRFDISNKPVQTFAPAQNSASTTAVAPSPSSSPASSNRFSIGGYSASTQKDISGRPFAVVPMTIPKTFMSPETTVNVIDKSRVAMPFDITKPTKITKDVLTNGRMPVSVSEGFRKMFGTAPTEDLDHAIAAELGGSNDPANLHNVPSSKNRGQYAQLENKLAKAVVGGQMAYIDAARQDLAQKGMTLKEDSALNTPVNNFLLNTPSVLKPLAAAQGAIDAGVNAVKAAPKAWFDFVSGIVERSPLTRTISSVQVKGLAQTIHDTFTNSQATSGITNPKDKNYRALAGGPQVLNAEDINNIITERQNLIKSGVPASDATIQASQSVRSKKTMDQLNNAVMGSVGGPSGDIGALDSAIAQETNPVKIAKLVAQREEMVPTMAKEQIPKFSEALSNVSTETGVRNAFQRNAIPTAEAAAEQKVPVTLFRGTSETPRAGMIGSDLGSGRYFAEDVNVAKEYGNNIEKTTLSNLKIKDIPNAEYEARVQKEYLKIRDDHPEWDGTRESAIKIRTEAKDTINKEIQAEGYDGISSEVAGKKIYNVFPDSVDKIESTPHAESALPGGEATAQEVAQGAAKDKPPLPPSQDPEVKRAFAESIPSADIPVKSKVNILDYLRTPEAVLQKMGLGNQAAKLRAGYEAYRQELGQQITYLRGLAQKAPGPESAKNIFQYLDGKAVTLSGPEQEVADTLKKYLATWADRLNLPKDGRITNYITHIFDQGFIQKEFDPELAKIIDARVPGSVYDPFVEKRLGKLGYKENVWQALDAYVKRGVRKVNMDPALRSLQMASDRLDLESYKYVARYVAGVNMRPTEIDSLLDNFIKQTPIGYKLGQRPVMKITQGLRNIFYRATLGLNIGSTLKNLTQGVNTYAELGERYTLTGYIKLLTNGTKELIDNGVLGEDLIQDQHMGIIKSLGQKVDKALFAPFEAAETINRGAAYYGAKAKALAGGLDAQTAIEYAKGVVRKTQFAFGSIDTPVALQSDIAKTVAQLQTFNIKQTEFLVKMMKQKDFAGLARWTAGSLATVYSVGKLLGMTPWDLIPSLKLGGSPTGQIVGAAADSLSSNAQTKAAGQKALISAPLKLLVPAGTQINKTIQGVTDVKQGKATTASGKTRYKVANTTPNLIRGALFGPQGLGETQDYYANSGSTKSKASGSSSKNRFSL